MIAKSLCCGCELCQAICPVHAIKMIPDTEGFLYPIIDPAQCNGCGRCEKLCPIGNAETLRCATHNLAAYAGHMTDQDKLTRSASGGLASAMAERVLHLGGSAFGVRYCEGFKSAEYFCMEDVQSIECMKGSKYFQARKGNIYQAVREKLALGAPVLFIGLPCEVAALKSYLLQEYNNLFTCELICKSVTSPLVARKGIDELEHKAGSQVIDFTVRHIYTDWTEFYMRTVFKNGTERTEPFFATDYAFWMFNFARPSCSLCTFKGDQRCADITIGDYWGIPQDDRAYNPYGVSIAFKHTAKADFLLQGLYGFVLSETDLAFARKHNGWVDRSVPIGKYREKLSKLLPVTTLRKARFACAGLHEKLSMVLPRSVKKRIKRLMHKIQSGN